MEKAQEIFDRSIKIAISILGLQVCYWLSTTVDLDAALVFLTTHIATVVVAPSARAVSVASRLAAECSVMTGSVMIGSAVHYICGSAMVIVGESDLKMLLRKSALSLLKTVLVAVVFYVFWRETPMGRASYANLIGVRSGVVEALLSAAIPSIFGMLWNLGEGSWSERLSRIGKFPLVFVAHFGFSTISVAVLIYYVL